jgi:hypothetical protein
MKTNMEILQKISLVFNMINIVNYLLRENIWISMMSGYSVYKLDNMIFSSFTKYLHYNMDDFEFVSVGFMTAVIFPG